MQAAGTQTKEEINFEGQAGKDYAFDMCAGCWPQATFSLQALFA